MAPLLWTHKNAPPARSGTRRCEEVYDSRNFNIVALAVGAKFVGDGSLDGLGIVFASALGFDDPRRGTHPAGGSGGSVDATGRGENKINWRSLDIAEARFLFVEESQLPQALLGNCNFFLSEELAPRLLPHKVLHRKVKSSQFIEFGETFADLGFVE